MAEISVENRTLFWQTTSSVSDFVRTNSSPKTDFVLTNFPKFQFSRGFGNLPKNLLKTRSYLRK